MKIKLLAVLCSASILYGSSEISLSKGEKNYTNSAKKVDGETTNVNISHKYKSSKISLGYLKDHVDLVHPITRVSIDPLKVEKYNIKYQYSITNNLDLKASYIKIIDNQAPTDQGKVYGLGMTYKFPKGFGAKVDFYKSDYNPFNVKEYDLALFKGFKVNDLKGKFTLGTKVIKIDGDIYNPDSPLPMQYEFEDKSYNTNFVKLGVNYNGYVAGVGAFFGKRIFTVLDDGTKVQHHAMEQDKTYMLSVGKKFKKFDIILKHMFQNGNELPENRDDVDTKVTSVMLNFKF